MTHYHKEPSQLLNLQGQLIGKMHLDDNLSYTAAIHSICSF